MRILITGGSGTLGKEMIALLDKKEHQVHAPTSSEMDITDFYACKNVFDTQTPELVIHCAAFTDVKKSEFEFVKSIKTNIIGTCNLIFCCEEKNIKLVYISTDYVFDGNKGNYTIEDPINPLTKYAKSKAAAELAVRMYNNSLVIRTSFFGHNFPYEKAFVDQYSTKDYIDIMAPKILECGLSNSIGIKHIYSKKETIYDKAVKRNKNIIPIKIKDINNILIPIDVSLI
jgi:dTDP-4-dehydrorhamnose reductase